LDFTREAPADPSTPFRVAGPGPDAIVLVHGFTSGPRSMRPWADALVEAGHTVSLPLLPGHGTSWEDLARTAHADWTRSVIDEFDLLQRNHRHVFVGGLSMGGAVALHLAARRAVAGVVLVNPALTFADRLAPFAGLIRWAVRSVPAIANDIALSGADEGAYPRTPVAGVHQLGLLFSGVRGDLARVAAPVLAFRSDTDHVVPETSIDALRAGLRRAGSIDQGTAALRVQRLRRSYHVATLDHDAPEIFAGTLDFMRSIAGGTDA
jgi:carboxylesterase